MKNKISNQPAQILIELPSWLGDCVMVTPAIENVIKYFNEIEITFIGSYVSIEIMKNHPKSIKSFVVNNKSKSKSLYQIKNGLGQFDAYFSFRSSLRSSIFKFFVQSKNKFQFHHKNFKKRHQVQKYIDFVNESLNIEFPAGELNIHSLYSKKKSTSKILGINPGGSYGDAKQWYPEKFATIAIKLSKTFDVIILGGKNDLAFASEIERILIQNNIKNYQNLAGQTTISQLIYYISNLDILITGDSGPMHIASSLKIPTVSIFGPTNDKETSPWGNDKNVIVKKNLDCQPCMQRTCRLKHHNCMKEISSQDVIDSIPVITS